jgi:hypothetical protein
MTGSVRGYENVREICIFFADMIHQCRKSCAVKLECVRPECRQNLKRLAVGRDGSWKAFRILLDPERSIVGEGILPASKPQKDKVKMLLARDTDPVIEKGEVKLALRRLDLSLGYRYESCVDMQLRELWKDDVGLFCRARRRIPQFAAEN